MKTFVYRAKKGPDDIIEGRMIAENAESVVARLGAKGYLATQVKEEAARKESTRYTWRSMFGVSSKELITFTRQLASLIRAGIPILRALKVLSSQTEDKYFGYVIDVIADKVKNGKALSEGMRSFPKIFSAFYTAMVRSGEDSGSLDHALSRLSDYYNKQARLAAKIKSAMVYPALVLVMGILTIAFVFTNVIPRIVPILLNLNTELPIPTKIMIWMSRFFRDNWGWMVLGALIFALIFNRALKNTVFRRHISAIRLRVPVFGQLIFRSELARFTRALEVALTNGIPILNAIGISLPIINEETLKTDLSEGAKGLESGESLSAVLKKSGVFPVFALNLIAVGEESGNLAGELSEVAGTFETECEDSINVMVGLIEPVLVLAVGLVVAFIVSAVLLPIFRLNMIQM